MFYIYIYIYAYSKYKVIKLIHGRCIQIEFIQKLLMNSKKID
jgi:hypothetical protein